MKVIIAGAGVGGMVAAEKLGKLGFDVTVYEKSPCLEEMRYDWHDDVSPSVFRRLGIEIPEGSFKKRSWTFVAPYEKAVKEFRQDETDPDLSVERRPLNRILFNRAKDVAEFVFGAEVGAAEVEEGWVKGVTVDGSFEPCDLLIDSLGVLSPVRESLPAAFNISGISDNEIFEVYRAFYARAEGSPDPRYTNKVYIKHLGEAGISWAILDNDPAIVNVLVGRVGRLDGETRRRALLDLKANNAVIGDTLVRGGLNCLIPVRYPATRMVANGYAAIGDAAYMTIPLLGSGIASAMLAGSILGETIGEFMSKGVKGSDLFSVSKLWKYQVRCFREFGAEHCGVDVLKRWMLGLDDETVVWFLGSGLLSNADLQKLSSGRLLRVGGGDALRKLRAVGLKKLPALMRVSRVLQRSLFAYRTAKTIPRNFNDNLARQWERRLGRIYAKTDRKNQNAD